MTRPIVHNHTQYDAKYLLNINNSEEGPLIIDESLN